MATILQSPDGPQDDEQQRNTSGSWRDYLTYFKSRSFLFTVLGILAASIVAFFVLDSGLEWYTNHGQRLEVDDYVGLNTADATAEIEDGSFRAEVIDSVFLVDEPPGIVLRQDPPAGAYVKENRRIYLTVTKTIPDEVTLPGLAGTYDFDRYNRKLAMLDVRGRVRDREFSSRYQPNTILKVYYEGDEITEAELKRGFRVPRAPNSSSRSRRAVVAPPSCPICAAAPSTKPGSFCRVIACASADCAPTTASMTPRPLTCGARSQSTVPASGYR